MVTAVKRIPLLAATLGAGLLSSALLLLVMGHLPSAIYFNLQMLLLAIIAATSGLVYFRYAKAERERETLNAVHESYLKLAAMTRKQGPEDELLCELLSQAVHLIEPAQKGSLLMVGEDGSIHFKCAAGFDIDNLRQVSIRLEDTFLAKLTDNQFDRSVVVDDMNRFNKDVGLNKKDLRLLKVAGSDSILSTMSTPIFVDGKLHGIFNLDSVQANVFGAHDVKAAQIYSYIAGDIIGLHKNARALQHLADVDTLTGCYNRLYLESHVGSWRQQHQHGRVIMVDMDNLKWINDNLGHALGDEAIETFAGLLSGQFNQQDIVARVGGDEFVVLTTLDGVQIESRFEQLNQQLDSIEGKLEGRLGFSFGFCELVGDWSRVLVNADRIMYQAKRSKKLALRMREQAAE